MTLSGTTSIFRHKMIQILLVRNLSLRLLWDTFAYSDKCVEGVQNPTTTSQKLQITKFKRGKGGGSDPW